MRNIFAHKLYLRDGMTTAMDLETGAYPVADYYDYWAKGCARNASRRLPGPIGRG